MMLGHGSYDPRDSALSGLQSADRRGQKVAFALDHIDILELDLVEHEQLRTLTFLAVLSLFCHLGYSTI